MADHTMQVLVIVQGALRATVEARDFDEWGNSPDHHEVIAPAYLAPLTAGAKSVLVEYHSPRYGTLREVHSPAGWRDGACVGTAVEYCD